MVSAVVTLQLFIVSCFVLYALMVFPSDDSTPVLAVALLACLLFFYKSVWVPRLLVLLMMINAASSVGLKVVMPDVEIGSGGVVTFLTMLGTGAAMVRGLC